MNARTTRRRFLGQSLGRSFAAAVALSGSAATAQAAWPSRPVKLVVTFPPGGSSDFLARVLAPLLTEQLGQPFVVDNRPGAGGMIAAQGIRREAADGQTFVISNNAPFTIAPTQFRNVGYDPVRDFTHIAYLGTLFGGCIAHPKVGVRTLVELVAKARAAPGVLTFGSSGTGSIGHIVGESFKRMADIDLLHVPYKGAAPLRQDLMAGIVDLQFEGLLGNLALLRSGALVALGSASPQRLPPVAEVATFREQGFDMTVEFWHGISGPAGLPADVVTRMEDTLQSLMKRQDVIDRLAGYGIFHTPMTRPAFNAFIAEQVAIWRPQIMAAGVAGQ